MTVSTVFTSCPSDIVQEHTEREARVNWQRPTAKDALGQSLPVTCNIPSGDIFAVPSSSEVICNAKDAAGNEATCTFRVTLKRKYMVVLLEDLQEDLNERVDLMIIE